VKFFILLFYVSLVILIIVLGILLANMRVTPAKEENSTEYYVMKFESERKLFRSLGYNMDTDSPKSRRYLSAGKADEILKKHNLQE
jgi:hypothetical protein